MIHIDNYFAFVSYKIKETLFVGFVKSTFIILCL